MRDLRHMARGWLLAAPLLYFLYFHGLTAAGLLGPDEPRYAAVAREMARSGDFVTPRLWGAPWFEKPPLLYWMTAAAFRCGLGDEVAPRLPVAIASVAFLLLFFRVLRREFGAPAAWFATAILGTSAGWLALSYAGVTDLPMAAAFSAAMLSALPWVQKGESRRLPLVAAFLGLAVLAKGLVPLALALPLLWFGRKRIVDLLHVRVWGVFLAVAAPWYLLCYWRNGWPFLRTFFWEHHFGRFASEALQHQQPIWFYVPVLLAGLSPWAPLLVLLFRRSLCADERRRFLCALVIFGLLFFSVSTNKLPGYLLPLLPPIAALVGLAAAGSRPPRWLQAACALSLLLIPLAAGVLPEALARGLSRAAVPHLEWFWLLPLAAAAAAWRMERAPATALIAAAMAAGVVFMKVQALPKLDETASARPLWRQIAPRRDRVCIDDMHRSWRYGLNYYSVTPLPDCAQAPKPLRVMQVAARPPELR